MMNTAFTQRFILFCLLMAAFTVAHARTFKVLDSSTGLPLQGVNARLVAHGLLPGIGHPAEITLREWNPQSDKNGEFSISAPYADRAIVSSLNKRGYGHIETVKSYQLLLLPKSQPEILYLTPTADQTVEHIRYLAYVTKEAPKQRNPDATPTPIEIAMAYGIAKSKVKNPREIEALRDFCQFSLAMQTQADNGWRDIGILPETKKSGQDLIEDCKAR